MATSVALSGRRSNRRQREGTPDRTLNASAPEIVARTPRRRLRRLTESEIDDLVARRAAGQQVKELARRFGVGRSTVERHLRERGVPIQRWGGRTLTLQQLEAAGRLYESGVNLIAVSEKFNVDRRYLREALPEAGFTLRRPGQQKRPSSG